MPNQWKLTSPLEEITPHILHLWKAHQTDKMIVENLQKVIDTSHYGISLFYDSPEDFGVMDFKVIVDQDDIDHIRHTYIKSNHPVFDLVPQPLNHYIQHHYDDLGRPLVIRQSAWHIYLGLLQSIQLAEQVPLPIVYGDFDKDNLLLLEHQGEFLCADDTYMGGIHGGLGLDASDHRPLDSLIEEDEPDTSLLPNEQVTEEEGLFAWFSDEEEEEEEDETHKW
ncbi:hypothetical protein EDD22DRAFT_949969 [Suillus occidentalis]|nr:hypothetical protein EDD22DRAFT_949969 [Suillus occidentalis]